VALQKADAFPFAGTITIFFSIPAFLFPDADVSVKGRCGERLAGGCPRYSSDGLRMTGRNRGEVGKAVGSWGRC
jgi:hypothetical protein